MKNVLKYPGSKWNIAPKLVSLIPKHHSYVEPYFGSGAVLFNKPESDIETVNDLDSDVTNLFRYIQKDAERLARLVMTTPFSREVYDKQFDIPDGAICVDPYERAAGFLIRCWQGHGFRTNGYKVGWKNDVHGREKMYALWNWYRLLEWVIEIAVCPPIPAALVRANLPELCVTERMPNMRIESEQTGQLRFA
ncbi:MAG: DNA adenine methylase [Acetivibrio ethanolgignens]